jgi:3-phosphoshikimate 1-carboxyvinyltransferase
MQPDEKMTISTGSHPDATVVVPGSKSYTHRMLIAAALSDGRCRIENPLESDDTALTRRCLASLGVAFEEGRTGLTVHGVSARFQAPEKPVDLGNSGTSMRLLCAVASLAQGETVLTGSDRMQQRPIQDLLDALNRLGVPARSLSGSGCPPVRIVGGNLHGGKVQLDCHVSSQFLSALLLIAPFAEAPVVIEVGRGPVSRPYVDMTVHVMEQFGVSVGRDGYRKFSVVSGQRYRAGTYRVEPDCSQAGYFWAAAAISGGRVKVVGTSRSSLQGDVRLVDCLEAMGCRLAEEPDGIAVEGANLVGIDVDMADLPDMVPTLAVTAAFARGTTTIRNIAHLRAKESDRLSAVVRELSKMGVRAAAGADDLQVEGGSPQAAEIETYDDHRIAMSFALAGLRVPGMIIRNPKCVEKSFPNFWEVFRQLQNQA